ncbi:hypothetical protein HME9302_01389 [Alteripontixanthobacter maritimus]|uniref:Uncharacterized protein n=1 Tax=Alteripontixanthobacter maritimus TaxID=2161824 RepID=A0A369QB98_9SPHN|nr:YdbH domain-containing protein [Alteripontixanthobacter maritimus]RDC60189.1 hypothetical protein HME9302_01389 [Alteripontixanthobacter maritimus]
MAASANDTEMPSEEPRRTGRKRRLVKRTLLAVVIALAAAIAIGWSSRDSIADRLIEDQLAELGLPATYQIERTGVDRQVLTNVVIGDPARPDLTIRRIVVMLEHRFGYPEIGRITLVEPRLYGSYRGGKLSFGTLDKVLFAEDGEGGLPDVDIALRDGRALLQTDYGPVGIKAEGEGVLADGFAGIVAIAAPDLAFAQCSATGSSVYGKLRIDDGKPLFEGPIRVAKLKCPDAGAQVAGLALNAELAGGADFASIDGTAALEARALSIQDASVGQALGDLKLAWRDGGLDLDYDISGRRGRFGAIAAGRINLEGALRARETFGRIEATARVEGSGLDTGNLTGSALDQLATAAEGTLLRPLLGKFRSALASNLPGGTFGADLTVRKTGSALTVLVPEGRVRNRSGPTLLSVSQVRLSELGPGVPRFSGNFAIAGPDMPQISGRMEQRAAGTPVLAVRMAEYRAANSSLAVPELVVSRRGDGSLSFNGAIEASGALPGGYARGMRLPVVGTYDRNGTLALWRSCTRIAFRRLEFADGALDGQSLTLCPARGRPILRAGADGFSFAAGASSLNLSGTLAGTPIRVASGPMGVAYPGKLSARSLDVTLGKAGSASRFTIDNLSANLSGDAFAGQFADAVITLDAVPLDIEQASGRWAYRGGRLDIADATFSLLDRKVEDRFEPLLASGAKLTLADSVITASAPLREPDSGRLVLVADLIHDLRNSTGSADLNVPELLFDDAMQPIDLTRLALGVVADVKGSVVGQGRIDWSPQAVTSSGRFTTAGLDLAAAFGPVTGASGTIVFDDLLGMTTAPDQRLAVKVVNPGIEVFDGALLYELRDGQFLAVKGGQWPFLGGELVLRPVTLDLLTEETRRYVLDITGLDAAEFIGRMELSNLDASGRFDGQIPLVFNPEGNGAVVGGRLDARPPGGNLSYVGALTYEDMTPYANFAFDALKSLDFKAMSIGMDGPLTGEIVTKVRFDGVSQGAGTRSNIITRRIGALPIRMNVNIRAPFYQLIASFKSLYDPASVRDPRSLGLIDADGNRLQTRILESELPIDEPGAVPTSPRAVLPQPAKPVQDEESEILP